jgi:hypothetical protein
MVAARRWSRVREFRPSPDSIRESGPRRVRGVTGPGRPPADTPGTVSVNDDWSAALAGRA